MDLNIITKMFTTKILQFFSLTLVYSRFYLLLFTLYYSSRYFLLFHLGPYVILSTLIHLFSLVYSRSSHRCSFLTNTLYPFSSPTHIRAYSFSNPYCPWSYSLFRFAYLTHAAFPSHSFNISASSLSFINKYTSQRTNHASFDYRPPICHTHAHTTN